MKTANQIHFNANYGLDAPGVVRNLLLAGIAGLAFWGTSALNLWSGQIVIGPIAGNDITLVVAPIGLGVGLGCTTMGLWMIWTSKFGKIKAREELLRHIAWTGTENVLDVGCGRGLMVIGAARRLTTGNAVGIDIWQAEDLSGNRPESVLENAAHEGVEGRIGICTADMRRLPFPENTFDVILSSEAIHNIPSPAGRSEAIIEIARVLRPGGQALIQDIRNQGEYRATLAAHDCQDIRMVGSRMTAALMPLITFGALRPTTLLVRKPLSRR